MSTILMISSVSISTAKRLSKIKFRNITVKNSKSTREN